jgi:Tfp pilus assembly protein PilF
MGAFRRLDDRTAKQSLVLFDQALRMHREGRLDAAGQLYEILLRQDRRNPDTHHCLGIVRAQQARHEEALKLLRRALNLRPNWPEANHSLGNLLMATGQTEAAALQYRKAVALKPDYAEAHNSLGLALLKLNRPIEAAPHFEKAIAAKPDWGEAHHNLCQARIVLGDPEAALRHFEAALTLAPAHAPLHHGIGTLLVERGQIEAGCKAFRQAIALDPSNPAYYLDLFHNERVTADEPGIAALEALAEQSPDALPVEAHMRAHFALAKGYRDLAQPGRALPHLLSGNALKRRQIVYDEAAELRMFDRVRAAFTAALMYDRAGLGDPAQTPVFIVGMPRSGGSLVEQILASHPQVFGGGELRDFQAAVAAAAAEPFPEMACALTGDQLRRLGADYLGRIAKLAPSASRIVDKMPLNILHVGLIHLALPNARIIHVSRDPIDTCLSCFSLLFASELDYAYDLGELGRYYRAYERLMRHWRNVLPPGTMLEVQYEAVVADLEKEARRVVAHCGLEWEAACLAFHQTQRIVRTASAAQVRRPIYADAVGRARACPELAARLSEALSEGGMSETGHR